MIILYINIFSYIYPQGNSRVFIEQILISYKSDKRVNTTEAQEKFIKDILKQSNIDFSDRNYISIPQFDLVFKKLSATEKRELRKHSDLEKSFSINGNKQDSINFSEIDKSIKNKYLTYLDTKKIYLSGMYIYKDSVFYGRVRENPYTHELFFSGTDVKNETNWVDTFARIIIDQRPTLLFTVRSPNSPLFLLFQNCIKVLEFDSIKKQTSLIYLEDYLRDKNFAFGEAFISDKRNEPVISY